MYDLEFTEIAEEAGFLLKSPHNETLDPRIEETRFLAYSVFAPIIVTVGIIGNLLTIIVLRLPQFRGATYTLFFALAISDLLSLVFCISMLVHLLQKGTRYYSTAVWYSYCELIFTNGPMSTSTLIIVCITIDRYFSVCRPTRFKDIHTQRYAFNGIIISLAVALTAWVPSVALKEPQTSKNCPTTSFVAPDEGTWWVSCMKSETRKSTWYIAYSWGRQTLTIFIPLLVLIVLNSLIVREFIALRKKKKQMMGKEIPKDSPTTEKRKKENKHLIHLLMAVMISFFITIVPSGIFGAIYDENLSSRFKFELIRAIANDLEILNHALNFYLYILCSKPIRDAIANTFRSQQKKLNDVVFSNILVVIQGDPKATAGGNNPKDEETALKEPVIGKNQSRVVKNKKTKRETQFVEIVSDNESSFNKIVSADEIPKAEAKKPDNKVPSDMQQDNSCFVFPLQNNRPVENVYYRAVVNHRNKPISGFKTIVHTVEIHNSQSEDDDDPPSGPDIEDQKPEKNIRKENEFIENKQVNFSIKENGCLTNEEGELKSRSRTESQKKEIYVIVKDEEIDGVPKIVDNVSSDSKEEGGVVNPAFELDEIYPHRKMNGHLPNGNVISSSLLSEKPKGSLSNIT